MSVRSSPSVQMRFAMTWGASNELANLANSYAALILLKTGLTDRSGCVCESRPARKYTLASPVSPASSRRSFMTPVKCFQLCTFHYRQRLQCDKQPFIKFTTWCPLNPILDATKINPLKCRTCNAISNIHYHEHCGQFVTAVGRQKSPAYHKTFSLTEGQAPIYWNQPRLLFLIFLTLLHDVELDVVILTSNTNSIYRLTDSALS
jgi:hypothetical protein